MQPWTLAAVLLCLSCCLPLSVGVAQYVDIDRYRSVGTVDFKGSKLRVFEVDGAHVAEPRVAFDDSCNDLSFSRVYMKYQLVLPIRIDANAVSLNTTTMVGNVTITGLNVKANKGLSDGESGLTVMVDLKDSGKANLVFLCSSFLRCRYLREEIVSNPYDIGRALKFEAVGRVGVSQILVLVTFGARSSANSPSGLRCDLNSWVVFQRRVDGSLSFAQNWDAYVKGFGNPETNYWMGLDRLAEMTQMTSPNDNITARCGLRIELEDWSGLQYSVEYKMFKVFGPEQNYRWQFGGVVGPSGFSNTSYLENDNNQYFSTFDKDNDKYQGGSCSQEYGGFGGWWTDNCGFTFLNGVYPPGNWIGPKPVYATAYNGSSWTPIKRSAMKVRCR